VKILKDLSAGIKGKTIDLAKMRQRKERLGTEVRRLVTAVSEAGHSKVLLAELARKEAELQEITDRLLSNSQESIEARVGEIRTLVIDAAQNPRTLLREDTALAGPK